MKTFIKLITLLWVVICAGCTDEIAETKRDMALKDKVGLYFSIPKRTEVTTRASSETSTEIQSVHVLLFDGNNDNSVLLDWKEAKLISSGETYYYSAELGEQPSARHAYIIANSLNGIKTASANWKKGETALSVIKQTLTNSLPVTSGVITSMPIESPLIGDCVLPGGVTGSSIIGSEQSPVSLTPATVKISVKNSVATNDIYAFELLGATLFNAPDKGYFFPGIASSSKDIHYLPYGKDGNISQMMVGIETVEGVSYTQPLYCYESLATDETSVIIKTLYNNVETFYRLNIFTVDKTALQDLIRGYHYKIVIREVKTAGYRTAEEARKNPASNGIIYEINAEDLDSYDIITNGVQYLGVSNSEYWLYNTNWVNQYNLTYDDGEDISTATPFAATILTYTTRNTWNEGSATASSGIHFQTETGQKASSIVLPLQTSSSVPVRKELKVFFDDDFTTGTIDIRIGDLYKVIKIKRELSFSVMGGSVSLGKNIVYATLKELSQSEVTPDPSAYGLSYTSNGASLSLDQNGNTNPNPDQTLYLQLSNYAFRAASFLHGELYFQRNTHEGRVKVSFSRDAHGIDGGDYSYTKPSANIVGTFHRNNEYGERLVQVHQCTYSQMPAPGKMGERWQARVLVGEDFIRLGEWDESLTFNESTKRFEGNPEDRPVLGDKTFLSGIGHAVRFRLGLTGKNTGKPNRYGLVQLLYVGRRAYNNVNSSVIFSAFIFVRQGEEADNILTPGETYIEYKNSSSAPLVNYIAPDVKYSPYCLVDPSMGDGGPDVTDHTQLTNTTKARFADYPTIHGYYFQWSGDRAFNPLEPLSSIAGWKKDFAPDTYVEHCPDGYITPPAKVNGINVLGALHCNIKDMSPLYTFHSDGNKVTPGIYLDGYFDRYIKLITSSDWCELEYNAPHTGAMSVSSYNTSKIQLGYLIFNPKTFASLYVPVGLVRSGEDGSQSSGRDYAAPFCGFWTSTPSETELSKAKAASIYGYDRTASGGAWDVSKALAVPIRCIKDPTK